MATLTAARPVSPVRHIGQPIITDFSKIPDDGVSTMSVDEWFGRLVEGLGGKRSDIKTALTDEEIDALP